MSLNHEFTKSDIESGEILRNSNVALNRSPQWPECKNRPTLLPMETLAQKLLLGGGGLASYKTKAFCAGILFQGVQLHLRGCGVP